MWRLASLIVLCTGCDAIFGLRDVGLPPPTDAPVLPIDRKLVAHYTLDALDGSNTAIDSAGHHDAICAKDCPLPGVGHASLGSSLVFNPDPANIGLAPEYLQIAAAPELELTPEYTIALWIRVDGPDGGCIIQQTYGSAMDNAWQLCIDAAGDLEFFSEEDKPDLLIHLGDDAPIGEWTHVALVHDEARKLIYANGIQLIASPTDVGPATFSAGASTYIGSDIDGGSVVMDPFEGAIDEVRIYARALQPSELQQLVASDP
jgi:hypothetical protein